MIYLMIMASRTNINQNAHTNGSTSRPLINAVNTGCIESSNPMIAPRPENMSIPVSEFNDVVSLLTTLNDKMTDVSSDVSELKVQCQVGAQSTGMQAVLDSDMDPQDIISSSRHSKISNIIRGRLKDINLKTDDLELIGENDDKPTWDVNVGLSDEFNKNLASDLMLYIRRQPVAAIVSPKELCGIICLLSCHNYSTCGISECIYCLTSVGVTIMTSSHKSALGLPTKLAPYRSDTVYPAMIATTLSQYEYVLICDKSNIRVSGSPQYLLNMFLDVINPTTKCLDHHNSYYNQLAASKLTEEDRQTNTTSNRRGNRKTALNKRRKRTYTKHKDAVTEKFNRDYNGVFYRDAMSGDETETNTSVVASRPDWRSDELNTVFDFLDELARDDLGKRATQLKSRSHVLVHKTIPRGLVTKMPTWSKRV
ncbi:hypothetical protein PHYBLDRAFT_175164 [Phycomyces blakesleeanus NRRL 1555(-)]|uniref:Uncharacterized protein n=1 Tax=Phycomyces blakesleeanus (strain ATCC 8743b / DSM 1359 / FGSC 10004 / NBRC 33097 / NRRL 1555) TaxID=763407 RepID=A0A162T580_PHYB8|nr:hypothetical protein PHYBLDRAFT_175164 [Phycomyces blakesleeanus NRRL 1555(-)]OAD66352.1 hypothetical protein PHYBLDRAFT_175164 [Phycomyces blakesleeanus NRRL 1555(-)]|eukprot:XP_018284392.1 hypothetical protein PHYBLDRAFT_175164 [Phycomyces blakesleeanus NRRL 1555(-)]